MRLKQRIFIDFYCDLNNKLTYKNVTQAAKAAGYNPRTAYMSGTANLKNKEVKQEIDEILISQMSKDKAISEALYNYKNATISGDRFRWFAFWYKLSGLDVPPEAPPSNAATPQQVIDPQAQRDAIQESIRKELQRCSVTE
jgi:hypothetical protein